MMDLIEFFRARLSEEAAEAEAAKANVPWAWIGCDLGNRSDVSADFITTWSPTRVLAEVEDWRNVLTAWEVASREPGPDASYAWVLIRDVVIRPRLARYADHPDFDPAWLSR